MKSRAHVDKYRVPINWAKAWDYAILTKPRISLFVALSTSVGFVLASGPATELLTLLHTLLAALLVAGGSGALNQSLERDLDARMRRTKHRPLPAGRMGLREANLFGLAVSVSGILYMGLVVNWLASLLAALTWGIYLFVYTPLKTRTVQNTTVGAVAGALPPVGGWAAAQGEVDLTAWVLFAIMFTWQFPHFLSIAWIYREDYARGGHKMLPVEDLGGGRTATRILLYSLLLFPIGVVPAVLGVSGWIYGIASVLLGLGLFYASFAFFKTRTDRCAKDLMRATLIYLPALWGVMILDKLVV